MTTCDKGHEYTPGNGCPKCANERRNERRRKYGRAPKGPQEIPPDKYIIPEGHELKGLSTLANADGSVREAWHKTHLLGESPEALPPDFTVKKISTFTDAEGNQRAQWTSAERDKEELYKVFTEALKDHAEGYRGLVEPIEAPEVTASDLLAAYPLGDPHIGMLSWAPETGADFDLHIATRELLACVRLMVQSAPPSENAIICNLGDFFHAQDSKSQTPKGGNRLDTDGRFSKILKAGFDLMRDIVSEALKKHEHVTVRNLPGNHDPEKAVAIAYTISAWFGGNPRVTVAPAEAPYQYDTFGKNLIGWAHGDGAKIDQLPSVMANDRPKDWGDCEYRVWHTGHVHHLTTKEFRGCVVKSHRTMAAQDHWHRHQGYRAANSLDVITYHKDFGQISSQTVDLKRVRHALST